ncbi:HNH endonuclease signature motif containing protein [Arthrobacter sp. B2a2-09]|uniref:HNH endonuclease signature motif containing protein n=1 Tax=Arthrobacter sp. B2a2-09 TaxID=2952822 RepID=UPI0022CD2DD5|nr:HNH endonuclease signature motif containing protein [Arthrobacter sp. B2a2-09]MCZ9880541.1 HNH endonuclease [Arthrobacter sp. B2a2-09]
MEAIGYFDTRQGRIGPGRFVVSRKARAPRFVGVPGRLAVVASRVDHRAPRRGWGSSLAEVRCFAETAVDDVGRLGFQEVVAFASGVEELSRAVEYLQLVAASGLDRVRGEEGGKPAASAGWTTGWAAAADTGSGMGWTSDTTAGHTDAQAGASGPVQDAGVSGGGTVNGEAGAASSVRGTGSARGGEFRSTAEHLRSLLRISAAEARRRLVLARELLPGRGLTGQAIPPRYEETGAALASGVIGSRPAGIITMALEKVRPLCSPEKAVEMEHALARTAEESDQDFLARVARRWVDAIDQDGPEPSEESLRYHQGAFLRRPRHGLAHLEIFATTEQYEHLLTVMNTATNPRTRTPQGTGAGGDGNESPADQAGGNNPDRGDNPDDGNEPDGGNELLDRRSRPQKLLDGLIGACKLALATGSLPATGGHRPQIMATIDHRELFTQYSRHSQSGQPSQSGRAALFGQPRPGLGTGSFTFTGPVPAATLRKLACDADIIPVVLGGEGQVLDIGRASRVFPAHLRKAITARDKGCAFPGCTMPAPWCEAHHIEYWSRGGPTSTVNGTLLCSHHHHLIHKEDCQIQVRNGIPWFIPPPHTDPHQKPRRNHYFQI